MKNVYVLLTRTGTLPARMIRIVGGDHFSHASIAYDEELNTLCSFARRYRRLPLPAGLVEESLTRGYFRDHPDISCALMALPTDDGTHELIRRNIEDMMAEKERYHYSVRGLISCRLGIEREEEYEYFCSHFIADVLCRSGALTLPKAPSLVRPQDFYSLPELECVYAGSLGGLWDRVGRRCG